MIIPYRTDVFFDRWPGVNLGIIVATVVLHICQYVVPKAIMYPMILDGWQPVGLFGHMWLHAGPGHLFGNMLFLWVFGNPVCAKLGNVRYLLLYILLGVLSGSIHVLFVPDAPAVGASGAINGVVGMFLVLYPENPVNCLYWFFFRMGTFHVASFWMILMWAVFDLWGAIRGVEGVAYFAHLGGLAAGIALVTYLIRTKRIKMDRYERSLLAILGLGQD